MLSKAKRAYHSPARSSMIMILSTIASLSLLCLAANRRCVARRDGRPARGIGILSFLERFCHPGNRQPARAAGPHPDCVCPRKAGEQVETWDGLDDAGRPASPGEYNWRGIVHGPITSHFQSVFYSPGDPPWDTYQLPGGWYMRASGSGDWLADHERPLCVSRMADGFSSEPPSPKPATRSLRWIPPEKNAGARCGSVFPGRMPPLTPDPYGEWLGCSRILELGGQATIGGTEGTTPTRRRWTWRGS